MGYKSANIFKLEKQRTNSAGKLDVTWDCRSEDERVCIALLF